MISKRQVELYVFEIDIGNNGTEEQEGSEQTSKKLLIRRIERKFRVAYKFGNVGRIVCTNRPRFSTFVHTYVHRRVDLRALAKHNRAELRDTWALKTRIWPSPSFFLVRSTTLPSFQDQATLCK